MAIRVEIDKNSGFCEGVIRAIERSEKFLDNGDGKLYSPGALVHNDAELERLGKKGLITISSDDLDDLGKGSVVLIRAHGEPPATYKRLKKRGIDYIDCTCPVVLQLQKQIRRSYDEMNCPGCNSCRGKAGSGQIIIYGKVGHAEVSGLVGQVDGDALVISDKDAYEKFLSEGRINLGGRVEIFSQTTKSPVGYKELCDRLERDMSEFAERKVAGQGGKITSEDLETGHNLKVHDTICRQVSDRYKGLTEFAKSHSVVVFVSGRESSNGRVLYNLCRQVNLRTYRVGRVDEVNPEWFEDDDFAGVCGATSTPKWLLKSVADKILFLND